MAIQFMFGVPVRTSTPKPAPTADKRVGNRKWALYVGDLDPQVTEADLIDAFCYIPMGPIASVRLCRDSFTGESLGYAYVNFFTFLDASKALTFMNHKELKGKPIRIMWSQRYPLTRKTGIGNLFVKNLDPSITSCQLQSMFGKFGRILSCKVAAENGNKKGFGFVQFDSEQSAMTARNALHDALVKGKKIYVSKFVKKSMRTVAHGEAMKASQQGNQLFIARDPNKAEAKLLKDQHKETVNCHLEKLKAPNLSGKNLDICMDEGKLSRHFSACGKIISVAQSKTHPVHYSSFHSFGKDLMRHIQQSNTGNQSFEWNCFKKNKQWNHAGPRINFAMIENKPHSDDLGASSACKSNNSSAAQDEMDWCTL